MLTPEGTLPPTRVRTEGAITPPSGGGVESKFSCLGRSKAYIPQAVVVGLVSLDCICVYNMSLKCVRLGLYWPINDRLIRAAALHRVCWVLSM